MPKGNRRTGQVRAVSGRPHAVEWREDDAILARMDRVQELWFQGYKPHQIATMLEPQVSRQTVRNDLARLRELVKEGIVDAREDHINNLREMQRKVYRLIEDTELRSVNKSALVAQWVGIEMHIAKLDASDRTVVEHTGKDGGPIEIAAVRERLLGELDRLAARRGEGAPDGEPHTGGS